jgi:hypothetical protein
MTSAVKAHMVLMSIRGTPLRFIFSMDDIPRIGCIVLHSSLGPLVCDDIIYENDMSVRLVVCRVLHGRFSQKSYMVTP